MEESKLYSSPAENNKELIYQAIKQFIEGSSADDNPQTLLEIASGTGQHVVYLAKQFPNIHFQPSDVINRYIKSISSYVKESGLRNVSDPVEVDITTSYMTWNSGKFLDNSISYILCVNMIHITSFECTEGLFRNSEGLLKSNGMLFMYGPLAFNDFASQTTAELHHSLRCLNNDWGVRNFEDLQQIAHKHNIIPEDCLSLPNDDYFIVWKKK